VEGGEQRHSDRYEPHCNVNLVAASSGTFFFFRVAAAVVFDVSRTQTFHSVSKVGTETIVLLLFDYNRLCACDDTLFSKLKANILGSLI
jgi:hypothetical protein